MKHPLWIVNSALLFLFIVLILFVYISQEQPAYREDIEPTIFPKKNKKMISKVSIDKIWKNDLFETYQRPTPVAEIANEIPLPPPPTPQPVFIPEPPKTEFLDPLDITLKGIMIIVNDDEKNRAIITNNKLSKEGVYKVGDSIEDAQLLRIFNNKVIFIRSNGQQEILYLRERDAKRDPAYALLGGWDEIVQKIAQENYLINPSAFSQRITNLAQFIDMLDITTVYKEGKSIGIRIGQISPDSFGTALGLQQNDLIMTINDIDTADTSSRFTLYKIITAMHHSDTIRAVLIRNNESVVINYTLEDFKQPQGMIEDQKLAESPAPAPTKEAPERIFSLEETHKQQKQIETLKERHEFAPTIRDIRARERSNMMQQGTIPRFKKKFKLTE